MTGRGQHSLFGQILDWMLAPLLLLWPISVVITWLVAQGIANQPYDRELATKVRLLGREIAVQAASDRNLVAFVLPPDAETALHPDDADETHYQVQGPSGEFLAGAKAIATPADEDRGVPGEVRFRDETLGGKPVRVAYMWVPGLDARGLAPLVQVAETRAKRAQLAGEIIKGGVLPQFVILPIAVLLVWLALARGIAPLNELQQRIRRRSSGDLSPIDESKAPEEVAPLVRAINDLLGRLDQSIRAQKHFLADAAHQLKTPLAGLRTQAELAERELVAGRDAQALRASLRQIAHSSQNAAHMVDQLLAMARAEHEEAAARPVPVDLAALGRDTVRDFVPRALDKGLDLGFEAGDSRGHEVLGHPLLLRELIRNLVDNALLYTPAGGTVTVRVVADPFGQVVVLQVEDSGPGIPAAEREKVFRPFYRALGTGADGSGLGLAIVREIAARHDADVSLADAVEGRLRDGSACSRAGGVGAMFTVRFAALVRSITDPAATSIEPVTTDPRPHPVATLVT